MLHLGRDIGTTSGKLLLECEGLVSISSKLEGVQSPVEEGVLSSEFLRCVAVSTVSHVYTLQIMFVP